MEQQSVQPPPMAPAGAAKAAEAQRRQRRERLLAVLTLVVLVAAWLVGYSLENADIEPYLHQAAPQADRIVADPHGGYDAWKGKEKLATIRLGEADGYGGPMTLAVAVDDEGVITGLAVVRHRETPDWFKRVSENGLAKRLVGKKYSDLFQLGADVDGVSGATYTSRGLSKAAQAGARTAAAENLGFSVPAQPARAVTFGVPEVMLLVLFALGIVARNRRVPWTKQLRWVSLLLGLVVLGFVYTNPLTISILNQLLLGFFPDWHTHLYWYLLAGGILFSLLATGKNPYCNWFCPFGAAQECLGQVGGAKGVNAPRFRSFLTWLQRGLCLAAIVIALLYRNPGISSYEIFGTMFDLKGTIPQFFLLGLVILASLFIRTPWCRYLCPLHPVESFLRLFRTWIKGLWPGKKKAA